MPCSENGGERSLAFELLPCCSNHLRRRGQPSKKEQQLIRCIHCLATRSPGAEMK